MQLGIGVRNVAAFGLDRAAARLPGLEPAAQGIGFGKSFVSKLLRRTGASFFSRSGSVDNGDTIFGPIRIDPELLRVDA
jgi:hypothetical protein